MKNLLFVFLIFLSAQVNAQSVSQVEISQIGKTMVVEYVLEAIDAQEILLYLSQDGGVTFSKPLEKVSGDIGRGVLPGKKRIVWNVLEEIPELVGDNVVFLVQIAEGLIWEAKNGKPRMEWVVIPAGTFMMGSPNNEQERAIDEGPQHSVTLSGFNMSKYEVSFAQYDAFCDATGRQKPKDNGWGRGNQPVINVNWYDARAFAQWMGCRLPTEAEWEYACRAGTTTPFNAGNCLNNRQDNYNGNYPYLNCTKGSNLKKNSSVGSYASNAWGLYDMHGNVWEWCSDWYGNYSSSFVSNPTGQVSGSYRILRGGSWYFSGGSCRSASRGAVDPSRYNNYIGFRVVAPN